MTYELKSELQVTQTQDDATSTPRIMEHNATLAFTVDSVDEDGGAKISMTFDAIAINIETGDSSESFSWTHNGGDRPDASMGEGINASWLRAGRRGCLLHRRPPDGQVDEYQRAR